MSDLISRQDAIKYCYDLINAENPNDEHDYWNYSQERINQTEVILHHLELMPSIQPEHQWVPCSERLPEEHEWIGTKMFGTTISDEVYVTFEAPDGQRITDHISFQNGKLSASDAERMRVWYKGAKPVAWMPLPEPWKGEEDEAD